MPLYMYMYIFLFQPLKKQKLGHLRVDEQGEVTYKKVRCCCRGNLIVPRPFFLDSVEHFDGFVAVGFAAFGEWVWFLLTPPSCGHTDWRTGAEATKRYFNDGF